MQNPSKAKVFGDWLVWLLSVKTEEKTTESTNAKKIRIAIAITFLEVKYDLSFASSHQQLIIDADLNKVYCFGQYFDYLPCYEDSSYRYQESWFELLHEIISDSFPLKEKIESLIVG